MRREIGGDRRFPEGSPVFVRFPADGRGSVSDRGTWPWLRGTIEEQCGPDEWLVTIEDRTVAELEDGSPAGAETPADELLFPRCFRDASELREAGPELRLEAAADGWHRELDREAGR
jgi:hypothetical protein